jgi:hypothetical protein
VCCLPQLPTAPTIMPTSAPISAGGAFGLRLGGTGTDVASAVVQDPNTGASYVCGYFTGTMWAGGRSLESSGSNDAFMARVDTTGTVTWLIK